MTNIEVGSGGNIGLIQYLLIKLRENEDESVTDWLSVFLSLVYFLIVKERLSLAL